jgi:quinol monooxygenase YgiN
MSKIGVVAKIPCRPGKRADASAALAELVDATHAEDGTSLYILHEDNKDENVLWMYELYDDQASFDAHMGSEAFQAMFAKLGGLVSDRAEMNILTPLSGKGL